MDIHEFFAFLGVCLLLHFNSIKKKKTKKNVLVKKRRMPDSPNFMKQQKQICSSVNHFTLAYSTYLRTIDRVDLKVGLVFIQTKTKQTNFEMVYDIYKTLD
jgi:hypothetical protein